MNQFRVIICGSRSFHNRKAIFSVLDSFFDANKNAEIVAGLANGPDRIAKEYAIDRNIPYKEFPANWNKYGKSAGYIRNTEMLKYASEQIPIIIAFWDYKSKGTKHMIDIANRVGAKIYIIDIRSETI